MGRGRGSAPAGRCESRWAWRPWSRSLLQRERHGATGFSGTVDGFDHLLDVTGDTRTGGALDGAPLEHRVDEVALLSAAASGVGTGGRSAPGAQRFGRATAAAAGRRLERFPVLGDARRGGAGEIGAGGA